MEARVARLEEDMSEVKGLLYNQMLPLLHRIDERLNHTATKADLNNMAADLRAGNAQTRADLTLSMKWSPPFLPPPSEAQPSSVY